jgi:diaminopimelate decarboxylase
MSVFTYKEGELYTENVSLETLANEYQTPLYIYSQTAIEGNFLEFQNAFTKNDSLICYAVKANSNLAVLNTIAKLGGGFDIVSLGELKRVIAAGGDPAKCVFSGVAKTTQEIEFALQQGIYCFNVESQAELLRISEVAKNLQKVAPISIRVNPNVGAKTHPYISTGLSENKFGIDILQVVDLYRFANKDPYVSVQGVDCHIGSQITEDTPFIDALDKVLELVEVLKKEHINIAHLDLGGGIGIDYENNKTIDIQSYISKIEAKTDIKIILEPGRAIVGSAGVFVTQVEFLKQNSAKNFAIVDGGMNDLLRPSLYQAYHNMLPIKQHSQGISAQWDVVGPVCETGDYFGKNRDLTLQQGDLIAVMDTGAYGFVMSSNYNTRPLVAEVMVKNNMHKLIRKRQSVEDLFKDEETSGINE